MGNRRGHHDGYRRIGAISGIDDGRWKTAILETSPFDFRYEKKWNGTQILIRSLGTEKSKGQQEPRNLPIEFVAIHEPTQQLEIESRKQWRGVVHIQADVDRRERSELRWEDQKKHQSDELAHVPDEPPPYPPKFGAAGFITFQVGLYSHVAPLPDQKGLNGRHYSAPKKDHLRESIETFLSLGEYESIPFAIYPLKNLRNVRYDLGMLKKEDGTVFRGWVKPGYVEYSQYVFVPRTETEREPRGLWRSIPLRIWELSQHDRFDLRKGVPFRFWLTVRADEDCEPGSYSTTIRITTSDSAFELPLKVEVLPFRLPSTTELGKVAGYTISPSISEFEYWNLREHNFNTVHEFWNAGINVWLTPNEIDINYGRIDEKMRFARRMDFRYFIIEMANVRKILRGGYPDSLHADQFGDWVELYSRGCFMMREHAKTSGWPELGFCPSDEPWGFYMWHLNEVVRRWMKKYDPATPVYANMYGGHHTHVMKNFDIINTNATGSDPFMAYECQQYGIDLWIYGSHREQFYPWAFDAGGIIKYRYNTGRDLFFRGASDYEPEIFFHRGEPVPRIGYERRRDGLDGCRYAWYLQRLLKDSPNPQIERLLEDLKYSIKANAFNRPGWRERDPNPGTLDLGRQKLMAKCQRLLKSWKSKDEQAKDGLTIAGRMASRENEIHKRNMGKPKGDLSYNAVRRQLVDWILIPNPGQGHD
ncbi:MAG: hypothetical protein QF473_27240, partial [Planctomycetota bacterium]|nr:hypothetical protein [Planctomycetota bacterium]